MSKVTNLILTISDLDDDDKLSQINSFVYNGIQMNLVSADFDKGGVNRTRWYGGSKFLEAEIYIGAFNHFPLKDFIDHLKQIEWKNPNSIQLFVKEQDDEKFKLLDLVTNQLASN